MSVGRGTIESHLSPIGGGPGLGGLTGVSRGRWPLGRRDPDTPAHAGVATVPSPGGVRYPLPPACATPHPYVQGAGVPVVAVACSTDLGRSCIRTALLGLADQLN